MKKEFDHETPELILILSKNKTGLSYEKIFQCGLDQIAKPHVALSVVIKPAHMKNMVKALHLMDVKGVFFPDDLGKKACSPALIPPKIKEVNVLVLKNGKYHGINTLPEVYDLCLKKYAPRLKGSRVAVIGSGRNLRYLLQELGKKHTGKVDVFRGKKRATALACYDAVILHTTGKTDILRKIRKKAKKNALILDFGGSGVFLAQLVFFNLKLWTGKKIDYNRLSKDLARLNG